LTAIGGGIELVWHPDGSFMQLPRSLLERSPFHDFLVPGLLLAVVVGGINTLAGVLVIVRHPRADAEAIVAGAILAGWIMVEVLLIRQVHWLHGAYLALGLGIGGTAAVRARREGTLEATTRAVTLALAHAFVGWALCGAAMAALRAATSLRVALIARALATPVVFGVVSASYFGRRGAWAPLRAALVFAALVALFDLVIVACFVEHSLAMFRSFVGSWLPLLLVFAATWTTGTLRRDGSASREARALTTLRRSPARRSPRAPS
jgi:hypothetical protein